MGFKHCKLAHYKYLAFQLLQKAFQARLIFKIGTSATTGEKNVVVWGDIHHKTSITGGP